MNIGVSMSRITKYIDKKVKWTSGGNLVDMFQGIVDSGYSQMNTFFIKQRTSSKYIRQNNPFRGHRARRYIYRLLQRQGKLNESRSFSNNEIGGNLSDFWKAMGEMLLGYMIPMIVIGNKIGSLLSFIVSPMEQRLLILAILNHLYGRYAGIHSLIDLAVGLIMTILTRGPLAALVELLTVVIPKVVVSLLLAVLDFLGFLYSLPFGIGAGFQRIRQRLIDFLYGEGAYAQFDFMVLRINGWHMIIISAIYCLADFAPYTHYITLALTVLGDIAITKTLS